MITSRHAAPFVSALALAFTLAGCPDDTPPAGDAAGDVAADATPDGVAPDGGSDVTPDDAQLDVSPDVGPDAVDPAEAERAAILAVPETESWTLPGLSAPVQVVRTEANIPHIYAATREDLGRAFGFVVARDRYFMMDLERRLGLGTLSELLGDSALGTDMESRATGITAVADVLVGGLGDEDLAYIQAFAEGVNAYIDQVAAGKLPAPSELDLASGLLGASSPVDLMRPFDVRGVMAMLAVVMYETNFETGDVGREASYRQLGTLFEGGPMQDLRRQGALHDLYQDLRPPFATASAEGWGLGGGAMTPAPDGVVSPAAPAPASGASGAMSQSAARPIPASLLARAKEHLKHFEARLYRDPDAGFGSNAWAVAGASTAGGETLVCGDGHLSLAIPTLMYQFGLDTQTFGPAASADALRQTGLTIGSLPALSVGTNGYVAWSQVNPVIDVTDWYREELQLDASGLPTASFFQGEWHDLKRVDEDYVIADVPILGSTGRTETIPRWVTFDGRWIWSIEGPEVSDTVQPEQGETVVNLMGKLIIPRDTDGDGKVTAISFDWAGFDGAGYLTALMRVGRAHDVEEVRKELTGQVGGGLYTAAGDAWGNILYSGYLAVPCRGYLQRDADGRWADGANPARLLDGTVYGGFQIPLGSDGLVDEAPGATDPQRCVVPYDQVPQSINPAQGYVVTANNQPAPITDDGTLFDDPWYMGGPWSSVRAATIAQGIQSAIDDGTADVDAMAKIQHTTRSRLGELFVDDMLAAIAKAKATAALPSVPTGWQARLVAAYSADDAAMDAVVTRLTAWRDGGFRTPSGVETFYNTPAPEDADDAVATMIFNAWFPRLLNATFGDEPGIGVALPQGSRTRWRALHRFLGGRGDGNPAGLTSWNPETGESVFFDRYDTPDVERSDELIVTSLEEALTFLRGAPDGPGRGGFGTDDMSQWIWGLRHQVKFESLLADFLGDDPQLGLLTASFAINTDVLPLTDHFTGPDDPRAGLKWFPRPGDNYSVDAANPGFGGTDFTHGSGPVMRMVIALKDGKVWGQNIIPGGQSGLTDSPHFADQAKLWLANKTVPLRFTPQQVVEGATGREVLAP